MARTISIGAQGYAYLRENDCFYVDKTGFVRDWWQSRDQVTLVCRPRRFGKTLTLDTVRCFLSTEYAGRGEELFGDMEVWADGNMRDLQGTVPVVALTFASCKGADYGLLRTLMVRQLRVACEAHAYLQDSKHVSDGAKSLLAKVSDDMPDDVAVACLNQLCFALEQHHGMRPVVLLDEYDTPMQEAWTTGCWDQMAQLVRGLFNATFKTNPALGRALVTGVTRVASESIFSDMNNPAIVTVTTDAYTTSFGFTEAEVFSAMDEMGLTDRERVRNWYDGFAFGRSGGIYNPWSITNYLKYGEFRAYWANSSSNALVSTLLRNGSGGLQHDFETLLEGESVTATIDESVSFRALASDEAAVWSLLLAAGYVKADSAAMDDEGRVRCELRLVNRESHACFAGMVRQWFAPAPTAYNGFTRALLAGDLDEAEGWLSDVLEACVSSFDGGLRPSKRHQPERFYHGLVLGMMVDLRGRYRVTSNGESGRGRYDVMLEPLHATDPALVMEFKVFDPRREKGLADTVARARAQIVEKGYVTQLVEAGISRDRIREVGLGFRGNEVRIG